MHVNILLLGLPGLQEVHPVPCYLNDLETPEMGNRWAQIMSFNLYIQYMYVIYIYDWLKSQILYEVKGYMTLIKHFFKLQKSIILQLFKFKTRLNNLHFKWQYLRYFI